MADAREILKRITDLQIISVDDARAVAAVLPANAPLPRLVEELRKRDLITAFQAEAIGREKPEELVYGGKYVCRNELGKGGMGCVYEARQGVVDRRVALKTITAVHAQSADAKQRFIRELRAAGQLEHGNIVRVYDGGVQGDQPYLVMEHIEGTTLHKQVVRHGPRPWAQACEWIAQAAEGLAYAHEKKVVHRDIKPDNLMLADRGGVKVLDMGLARFLDESDDLTQTASMMGTIDYMAPEQSEDTKRADERSDIYSLGCTLYFLCVGKAVFAHRNGIIPKINANGTEAPPKLRDGSKDAPAELEAIFQKMVRKQPADRYQTMTAITEALRSLTVRPQTSPNAASLQPQTLVSVSAPNPQPQPVSPLTTLAGIPVWVGAPLVAVVIIFGLLLAIPMRENNAGRNGVEVALGPKPDRGKAYEFIGKNESSSTPKSNAAIQKTEETVKAEGSRPMPINPPPSDAAQSDSEASAKSRPTPEDRRKLGVPPEIPETKKSTTAKSTPSDINSDARKSSVPASSNLVLFVGSKAGDEIGNALKMKLIWCPPGRFTMGSPKSEPDRFKNEDQAEVRLTHGFWLGKYEVTQEEWHQVMGGNPSYFQATGGGKDKVAGWDTSRFPVEYVSWYGATDFCRKLTEQERKAGHLPDSWEYRLPTEAQWEYACRAGTKTATAFGDKLGSAQANFGGNYPYNGAAKGPYLGRTTQVGSYAGNAWGLCDMHGNVWEWCRDEYDAKVQGGDDPINDDPVNPRTDMPRVYRGGSWLNNGRYCRSAFRSRSSPGHQIQNRYWGLRVAAVRLP